MSGSNQGLSPAIRGGITLVLIVIIGGLIFWLGQGGDPAGNGKPDGGQKPEVNQPRTFSSSIQCKECHERAYKEWRASHHAMAYTNPEVRKLSDDFAQKECRSCHLPQPILQTGAGERTLYRQARPDDGVDCLSCHLDPQGRIAGRNASDKGCQPVANADLISMKLCESCHNQHQTTDQWRASNYPARGITCNSCHMAEVKDGDTVLGRHHGYAGCHDLDTLKSAAVLRIRHEGGKVYVEVENTGAGHNFPTEERHRAVDIVWRVIDQEQKDKSSTEAPFARLHRFRQPYRGDPGPNTQLPANDTWKGEIELPAEAKGKLVQVRMIYKLTPFLEDHQGQLLAEQDIQP